MRLNILPLAFALAAVVALSGCATPHRLPLPPATDLQSSDVLVGNDQAEIDAQINHSNLTQMAGGGLLFALADVAIDKSRANKASDAAAPIRNALLDYDMNQHLREALERKLRNDERFTLENVDFVSLVEREEPRAIVQQADAESVFVVDPYFSMAPGFSAARVVVDVELFANCEDLREVATQADRKDKTQDLLYRNEFFAEVATSGAAVHDPDNPEVSAATEQQLKQALDTAVSEVADMLIYDIFLQPLEAETRKEARTVPVTPPVNGHVVKEKDNRTWVRLSDKRLASLEG